MTILFTLKESIYDCQLQITDTKGKRLYFISALNDNKLSNQYITIDVYGNEFDLVVIPMVPDYQQDINEFEETGWKGKLANKATKVLLSSMEKMMLRVGCQYHIRGLDDGDIINISFQNYTFGTFDKFDVLDLMPIMYTFFEVSHFNNRFEPVYAFETNRKDVIKAAKAIAAADLLGNGLFAIFFTYPMQLSRVKRLTKNKKIFKILHKFHNMSNIQRQKLLDEKEKFNYR